MSSAVRKIVVFKEDTPPETIEKAIHDVEASGGQVTQRYTEVMLGFAAEFPEASVNALSALEANPQLDYMEDDGIVTTQ
ncbi:MAG: serine proteinase inhibitor IA-1 [Benniella sp.]|nr:MAG: serine proteinase inhibitor IA-1 [Benniella sp.]